MIIEKLLPKINISKLPLNQKLTCSLDPKTPWIKKLLIELNENLKEQSDEEKLQKSRLEVKIDIIKQFKPEYSEYLLLNISVKSQYLTECVRSLKPMDDFLEFDLNVAFLAAHLEKETAFKDQLEFYEKDTIYELYFYQKGSAQVDEMLHEQIYLNINQYPVKETDPNIIEESQNGGLKH